MRDKTKKIIKIVLAAVIAAGLLAAAAVLLINAKVRADTGGDLIWKITDLSQMTGLLGAVPGTPAEKDVEALSSLQEMDADCILILGAGIEDDSTPSPMLKDRLDVGVWLYKLGAAPKILLSGDNGSIGHNEIHVMLNYVIEAGVPREDIFCDHAGFSTYDSMYRARDVFCVSKAIVITQEYHEYRALYIGQKLGLEVKGVSSDQERYAGQFYRDFREMLAIAKDFFKAAVEADPVVGGEVIPISGSGLASHGE